MTVGSTSVLEWLNSEGGVGRKRQLKVAEWICDPNPVRQTQQLEFTDLTNINHRIRTEVSDPLWPLSRRDGDGPQLVVLGFMRRGIPLQHTKVTLRRNGNEFPLTRLKMSQTEELALALLDSIWTQCSKNELKLLAGSRSSIPRPFEFYRDNEDTTEYIPPTKLDGSQRYVSRFWREFLGIGNRNVNADWSLFDKRFDLRESWRASDLWRQPLPQQPKWSFERALLAKLSARLAFSYILCAWVPGEKDGGDLDGTPVEVELEFQERVLDAREQEKRVVALRQRAKKAFARTLALCGDEQATTEELVEDSLRLDYVPETYLGLLDPALDNPDDGRRIKHQESILSNGKAKSLKEQIKEQNGGMRSVGWIGRVLKVRIAAVLDYLRDRAAFLIGMVVPLVLLISLLYINAIGGMLQGGIPEMNWLVAAPGSRTVGLIFLIPSALVTGYLLASRFAVARRLTVILPTWSQGKSSPIYEVTTPKEFSVWQGILARPSNRGRGWKTRPAIELGMKASFWWQDPSDRGHVPAPVPGRPHLLIMELRARMSSDLLLYGGLLSLLAAGLLLTPAILHLYDPGRWALLENAAADTVATVLLLLPTAGGALLVRPGEDPIASRLLRSDRLAVALGAVITSALAVAMILILGWPSPGDNPQPAATKSNQVRVVEEVTITERVNRINGNETKTEQRTESLITPVQQSEAFWTIWLVLGFVSLSSGVALFIGRRDAGNLSRSQPAGRQGNRDSSRRKPLDVPAPLPSLSWRWGRKFARRTLLRIAPKRGIRRVRPTYSLVLPAEGSRIYTPPSPTILCLVRSSQDMDKAAEEFQEFIEKKTHAVAPILSTNDIAWVVSSSLRIVQPVETVKRKTQSGRIAPHEELQKVILHLLRLKTANARPDQSKPTGNGGGFCLFQTAGETDETFDALLMAEKLSKVKKLIEEEAPFKLSSSKALDKETWKGLSAPDPEVEKFRRSIDRAVLDFDALLLVDVSVQGNSRVKFKELKAVGKALSHEAAERARDAGSGPGAHPWPSSLESPLAGESDLWNGTWTSRTISSLRWPLLRKVKRNRKLEQIFQRQVFDHGYRNIPAAYLGVEGQPDDSTANRKGQPDPSTQLLDWIEGIPRVYSRWFARGGVPSEDSPSLRLPGSDKPKSNDKNHEEKKPKVVYIAGNVGSGKSTLALKLRQKMAERYGQQWEVLRPDSNHNLFFQLLNLSEPRSIDEIPGSYFRYGINRDIDQFIAYLMQVTFLLDITSRLRELNTGRLANSPPDGIIVEYWPQNNVEVMARAHLENSEPYMTELEEIMDACRQVDLVVDKPTALIIVAEDEKTLIANNAKRQSIRRNEKLDEEYLSKVDSRFKEFIISSDYVKERDVPQRSPGRSSASSGLIDWRGIDPGNKVCSPWVNKYLAEKRRSTIIRYRRPFWNMCTSYPEVYVVIDGKANHAERYEFSDGVSMEMAGILKDLK